MIMLHVFTKLHLVFDTGEDGGRRTLDREQLVGRLVEPKRTASHRVTPNLPLPPLEEQERRPTPLQHNCKPGLERGLVLPRRRCFLLVTLPFLFFLLFSPLKRVAPQERPPVAVVLVPEAPCPDSILHCLRRRVRKTAKASPRHKWVRFGKFYISNLEVFFIPLSLRFSPYT